MSTIQERQIGEVGVDTGKVVIGDPAYVEAVARQDHEAALRGDFIKEERRTHCIVAFTPHGDGVYPVHEQLDEHGQRVGLRIDLRDSAERGEAN